MSIATTTPEQNSLALVCHQYGSPPDIRAQALTAPHPLQADEVRINVHYAAFNFTDHLMIQGRYQDRPQPPFIPGLDGAGLVCEVGANVSQFKPGDKVVSSGMPGAWATQLTAPAHRLVPVPDQVELTDAVGSINSHLTAYHGLLDRAQLQAGERVLVLGASGAVGKACIQIARHAGAQVYTAERENGGLRLSRPDASSLCVPADELKQGLRTLLGTSGADVIIDPVGDQFTEAAVRNLAWRGRLLVVGFAAGDIPQIPTNLLLLKGASVMGVYCGGLFLRETPSFTKQLAAMLELIGAGVLTPAPHTLIPAHQFTQAWDQFAVARGKKIILDFSLGHMPDSDTGLST